jgi:hypothetical protein
MASDFYYVFGSVRPRLFEERDDYLVDRSATIVQQLCQFARPGFPVWLMCESQYGLRNSAALGSRETDNAKAASAQRSGKGDDGIVGVHGLVAQAVPPAA